MKWVLQLIVEEFFNYLSDAFDRCEWLELPGAFEELADVKEHAGVDAVNALPMTRQDPLAAQSGQLADGGTVSVIVAKTFTGFKVNIKQRRLEYAT